MTTMKIGNVIANRKYLVRFLLPLFGAATHNLVSRHPHTHTHTHSLSLSLSLSLSVFPMGELVSVDSGDMCVF